MIISASRRTDIPGLYLPWLLARLEAGYLLNPNPFNRRQVRRVSLRAKDVQALVLWTRNGRPLHKRLGELQRYGIPLLVHYSITGYPRPLEPRVPPLEQALDSFVALSRALSAAQLIWRYDPILVGNWLPPRWHLQQFARIAAALEGHCVRVVISFTDFYRKTVRQLRAVDGFVHRDLLADPEALERLVSGLVAIARRHGMQIESCAEAIDLDALGVAHGRCIDPLLLQRLFGITQDLPPDRGQRDACGCARAIDIGQYNCCPQGCAYCYANDSRPAALRGVKRHHSGSEWLLD